MNAAGADVVEVVGEGVGEGGSLGCPGGLDARPVQARKGVRVRVDHLGDRRLESSDLLGKPADTSPCRVGDLVRSVVAIVHPSKDRLVLWETHARSRSCGTAARPSTTRAW